MNLVRNIRKRRGEHVAINLPSNFFYLVTLFWFVIRLGDFPQKVVFFYLGIFSVGGKNIYQGIVSVYEEHTVSSKSVKESILVSFVFN